jgi:hypothetical protein
VRVRLGTPKLPNAVGAPPDVKAAGLGSGQGRPSSIGNQERTAATVANSHTCSGISAVVPLILPIFAFAKKALLSPFLMVCVP